MSAEEKSAKEAPKAPKAKEPAKPKETPKPKEQPKKDVPKPVKTKDEVKKGGKAKDLKAQKSKKAVLHGVHDKRIRKQRTTVHFRRPKTFMQMRTPKYPRKSTHKRVRFGFCFDSLTDAEASVDALWRNGASYLKCGPVVSGETRAELDWVRFG